MLLTATVCAGVKEVITDTAQLNHSENISALLLIITSTFLLCRVILGNQVQYFMNHDVISRIKNVHC